MDGFAGPIKLTCADHNGHQPTFVQQFDGSKWVKVATIAPQTDKVQPLLDADAKAYAEKNARLAEAHGSLRQQVVREAAIRAQLVKPAANPPRPSPCLSPQAGRGEEARCALLSPACGERLGEGPGE